MKTLPPKYDDGLLARLWSRIDKTQGCWLWTRSAVIWGKRLDGTTGNMTPWRVVYEISKGNLKKEESILQTCGNKRCCNPDHLTIGRLPGAKLNDEEWRARLIERFWAKVDKSLGHGPTRDCWIWTGAKISKGYGALAIRPVEGVPQHTYAHRLAYELAHGGIPKGMYVCHKCDNPSCVNPDHLFATTHWGNMFDGFMKGRVWKRGPRKERKPKPIRARRVLITPEQGQIIQSARTLRGIAQPDLSYMIGTDVTHLCRVEKGKRGLLFDQIHFLLRFLNIPESVFNLTPEQVYEYGPVQQNPLAKKQGGEFKPYVRFKRGPAVGFERWGNLPPPDLTHYRADLIRYALRKKGINNKTMVKESGVSQYTFHRVVLGEKVREDALMRIVNYAGLQREHVLYQARAA